MSQEEDHLLRVLVCPFCGDHLRRESNSLECQSHSFPILDGIPIFSAYAVDRMQLNAHEQAIFDEQWSVFDLQEQTPLLKADMRSIRDDLKGSLVLDIGCGALFPTALVKLYFKPRGIFAIDFSYHQIKTGGDLTLELMRISDEGIFRVVSDLNLNRLPFASSVFDFVIGRHVLHHLDDPNAILREVKRVLKPHGVCWFLETCKPYVPLFKRWSPFKVMHYFRQHLPVYFRFPQCLKEETSHLRSFDRPKHLYEWKKIFSRYFSIKYFGFPHSTYYIAEDVRIVRKMPDVAKKLVILAQFYMRVLFEYPSIQVIGVNSY